MLASYNLFIYGIGSDGIETILSQPLTGSYDDIANYLSPINMGDN